VAPEEISLDRDSHVPYFAQVIDNIRERVADGTWPPGTQIPGEPELCKLFAVSRTVIRQALAELDHDGLVVRKKGKGTFIAEPKISESLVQRLTGFYEDMVDRGHTPVTRVLQQQVKPANSKIAAHLAIKQGTPIIEIERLRFIEDEPIVLVTTHLPHALCPDAATTDFSALSLYQFLEEHYGLVIVRGHRTLEAVAANEYEARSLGVTIGAPLILLDSVSYLEDGTPLEYYHARHRGDRSKFEVELIRMRAQGSAKSLLGGDDVNLPPSN
jgi:GntR family transcriptional regulator